MEIWEKLYIDTKNDMKLLLASEYSLLYFIGVIGLIGLFSGYFGFVNTFLLGIIGFSVIWTGIYLIGEIFEERKTNIYIKIQNKLIRLVISLILIFLVVFFVKDTSAIIFLVMVLLGGIWQMDSRMGAVFSLGTLIFVIIFLLIDMESKAEVLATWLYYFLVVSTICGLVSNSNSNDNAQTDLN